MESVISGGVLSPKSRPKHAYADRAASLQPVYFERSFARRIPQSRRRLSILLSRPGWPREAAEVHAFYIGRVIRDRSEIPRSVSRPPPSWVVRSTFARSGRSALWVRSRIICCDWGRDSTAFPRPGRVNRERSGRSVARNRRRTGPLHGTNPV